MSLGVEGAGPGRSGSLGVCMLEAPWLLLPSLLLAFASPVLSACSFALKETHSYLPRAYQLPPLHPQFGLWRENRAGHLPGDSASGGLNPGRQEERRTQYGCLC